MIADDDSAAQIVADDASDTAAPAGLAPSAQQAQAQAAAPPQFNEVLLTGFDSGAGLTIVGDPGKSLTLTAGDTLSAALSSTTPIYHPITGALTTDGTTHREWVHRMVDAWLNGHGPDGVWAETAG